MEPYRSLAALIEKRLQPAMQPGQIIRDRRAELGKARFVGIKGMPGLQGCGRGGPNEARCRQVPFAVPQRDRWRIAHSDRRDLGDAGTGS